VIEMSEESNDSLLSRIWSKLVIYLWLVSIIYLPISINVYSESRILTPIFRILGFHIHLISYGDIEFWFYFGSEAAIKLSLLGAIFPFIIGLITIALISKKLNSQEKGLVLLGIGFSAVLSGMLGGGIVILNITGLGPGIWGIVPVLLVQILVARKVSYQSSAIIPLVIYSSSFFGLFIGDLILAYRYDFFRSVVTGGLLLSDGLVWIPSAFSLILPIMFRDS